MQNRTPIIPLEPGAKKPLDHPSPSRPHRLYVAVTNQCNRACPWCSTYSSPEGNTFLSIADYLSAFPEVGELEVQLEGGEPTIHPDFDEFVRLAITNPRVTKLVVCSNGVRIPRTREALQQWLSKLGQTFTLKLSINHHLLDRDSGLINLAKLLVELNECGIVNAQFELVFNVRLRRGYDNDDERVLAAIETAGLRDYSNVFFLQRYGFAEDEQNWDVPFLVGTDFSMVNPDGKVLGPDLLARSEAMGRLP